MMYKKLILCCLSALLIIGTIGSEAFADIDEGSSSLSNSTMNSLDITTYGIILNTEGTTSGNLVNGGRLAVQGKWTYFSLPGTRTTHYSLYRAMNDCETGLKPIIEYSEKRCFNVIGEWVYYIDNASGDSICRTKTDGSTTERVIDGAVDNFYISDGYLYFLRIMSIKELNAGITEFEDIKNEGIDINYGVYKNEGIFKVKLETNNDTKGNPLVNNFDTPITQGHFFQQIFAYNKKLYAIAMDITASKKTTETLYSMGLDGTNLKKVSDDFILNPLFYKDHIYYTINENNTTKLYRINLDGTNKTKISDKGIYSFNIADDWIYYSSVDDKENIFKMRLDGTSDKRLTNNVIDGTTIGYFDAVSSIYIVDDSIFYLGKSDSAKFRRVTIDGSLEKVIN